jgi:hypothetical protein
MVRVLTVQRPGAAPSRRELAGPVTAGGSRADELHVPGLPPGALRLVPAPAGLVAEAATVGVRAGGHAVHPGARRLLRPGERIEVAGATLALEPLPRPEGTRAAASPLLRGELPGAGPAVVVLTGPRAGERHAVGDGLTVGRGRAASLRVADPLASRVHLRLRSGPGGVTAEDLGSKNGVRVNGARTERGAVALRAGDELALGDTELCLEDPWPALAAGPAETQDATGAPPGPVTAGGAAAGARGRLRRAVAVALLLALCAAALAVAGP